MSDPIFNITIIPGVDEKKKPILSIASSDIPEFEERAYPVKEVAVEYGRAYAIVLAQMTGEDVNLDIYKNKDTVEKTFTYNKNAKLGPDPKGADE